MDANHIIGCDIEYVIDGQGEEDIYEYTYSSVDKDIRSENINTIILKADKVTAIQKEIGKKPVLAFGNSFGDGSMLTFVTVDNPYKSAGFMVVAD